MNAISCGYEVVLLSIPCLILHPSNSLLTLTDFARVHDVSIVNWTFLIHFR